MSAQNQFVNNFALNLSANRVELNNKINGLYIEIIEISRLVENINRTEKVNLPGTKTGII